MQTASFRIRTRVAQSTFYKENRCTTTICIVPEAIPPPKKKKKNTEKNTGETGDPGKDWNRPDHSFVVISSNS